MSIHLNSGPYVDINDPHIYFESAQGVPQDEAPVDQMPAFEQEVSISPSMRPRLLGLVAEQYLDRDAFALVHRLNSSVLQAGLLHRVRTLGDNALELCRYIEGLGRDGTLSTQFLELIDRIRALPEPHQYAPLETLLQQCLQAGFLPDPKQLCMLATMTASRSIEKVDGLSNALNLLLLKHDFTSRTNFLLRFLSIAMKANEKSELSNGVEYSATFLRVLANLVKVYGCPYGMADVPPNFKCLPFMGALNAHTTGKPQDKLTVLSFLLDISPSLDGSQHQIAFEILKTLPIKEYAPERTLVFKSIFYQIGKVAPDVRSKVAGAYIELISQFDSKDRERSLYLMFGYVENSWNFKELTQKFFAALSQLYPRLDHMAMQAICHAPYATVARRTCEEFVRYIQTEPRTKQREILMSMLKHSEIVRKHSHIGIVNFKMDYVTPIEKGLAALKS